MATYKLALVQNLVGKCKNTNLESINRLVKSAVKQHSPKIVLLPECCNSPYGSEYFEKYAEKIGEGKSHETFSNLAKECVIYLIAGSIPEKRGNQLFNTTLVYNPEGSLICQYSKKHLFDIDIPGGITFQESKTITAGSEYCTFDTPFAKVGLSICFDVRFPEQAQYYARQGCNLLVYPGAFNMTTGPKHWELLVIGIMDKWPLVWLARARAVDSQAYVALASPARDTSASYVAWGHSTVVDPWGEILSTTDHNEGFIVAEIDPEVVKKTRMQIPIL